MIAFLVCAVFVLLVCAITRAVTVGVTATARAARPLRGWFPGGEEDEPAPPAPPAPAPPAGIHHVPTWARP